MSKSNINRDEEKSLNLVWTDLDSVLTNCYHHNC